VPSPPPSFFLESFSTAFRIRGFQSAVFDPATEASSCGRQSHLELPPTETPPFIFSAFGSFRTLPGLAELMGDDLRWRFFHSFLLFHITPESFPLIPLVSLWGSFLLRVGPLDFFVRLSRDSSRRCGWLDKRPWFYLHFSFLSDPRVEGLHNSERVKEIPLITTFRVAFFRTLCPSANTSCRWSFEVFGRSLPTLETQISFLPYQAIDVVLIIYGDEGPERPPNTSSILI